MLRIFVIGRNDGTLDVRGRIADHIQGRYGAESVVRDVFGRTLPEYLELVQGWMRACRVALVVMGPEWTQARDASGQRLLDNPYDPVRVEVRTALEQGVLVVPLLVQRATMPRAEDLPPDIAALSLRQALTVRGDPDFSEDMLAVYAQINTQLTWRPASLLMVVLCTCGLVAEVVFFAAAILVGGRVTALTYAPFFIAFASYFVGGIAGVLLSITRRHWLWLGGIVLALLALVGIVSIPSDVPEGGLIQLVIEVVTLLVLLAFGLFGPRRETAGLRGRSTPPASARVL